MPFTRTINFGQALRLEATVYDGGLKAAVAKITEAMGAGYGTRPTFAELFKLEDAPTKPIEQQRAYLLLLALDQNPADWGMGDFVPPRGWSEMPLDLRSDASGWSSLIPAAA